MTGIIRCEDCIYAVRDAMDGTVYGRCHRHPPIMTQIDQRSGRPTWNWPQISIPHGGCGEGDPG